MFRSLTNSWALAKASASVLRADKELMVFPVVSAVAAALVLATFFVPVYASGVLGGQGQGQGRGAAGYAVLFLFYLCQYMVTFYFNTALVGAALVRLQGGDPTVRDGFGVANRHLGSILGYSAIAATVGMVLGLLVQRSGRAGQVIGRIGGLGWSLATFLVVPVLVAEGLGPVDAIERSAGLLKRTWGEQIAGSVGMGLAFFVSMVLAIGVGVVLIVAAASTQVTALIVAAGLLLVVSVLGLGLVYGALTGIYTAAVYRYAVDPTATSYFPPEMMRGAFKTTR
jgi:hypothetical protein